MHWGRKTAKTSSDTSTQKNAVRFLAAACILGILWIGITCSGHVLPDSFSEEEATAALIAFQRDHTTLSSLLGIHEFFPSESIPAGTFSGSELLRFHEYLLLAWRRLWSEFS